MPLQTPPDAPYRTIAAAWRALRENGWSVREVACVGAPRTLLVAECGPHDAPVVALSAGMHGDEPAAVFALLELAQKHLLPKHFAYRVWPCINPTGFDARTRTNAENVDINRTFGRGGSSPESKAIIMANRDRKFALAIDMHEDDETAGGYAYAYRGAEALLPEGISAVTPDPHAEAEALGGLSYTLLLVRNAAAAGLTLESDATLPFERRIAWHTAVCTSVLHGLLQR